VTFVWDEDKGTRNLATHGVAFDETMSAFDDPLFIDFFDPEHSEDAHRYIRVGSSERERILDSSGVSALNSVSPLRNMLVSIKLMRIVFET
jgi:uncharacterized DUF497 family protein